MVEDVVAVMLVGCAITWWASGFIEYDRRVPYHQLSYLVTELVVQAKCCLLRPSSVLLPVCRPEKDRQASNRFKSSSSSQIGSSQRKEVDHIELRRRACLRIQSRIRCGSSQWRFTHCNRDTPWRQYILHRNPVRIRVACGPCQNL